MRPCAAGNPLEESQVTLRGGRDVTRNERLRWGAAERLAQLFNGFAAHTAGLGLPPGEPVEGEKGLAFALQMAFAMLERDPGKRLALARRVIVMCQGVEREALNSLGGEAPR